MNTLKISIIGGGASGLFYAATAADLLIKNKIKAEICIIEKEQKLGRKLLATGNGRCNLTNTNISSKHYRGSFAYFSESIFAKYDCNHILKLFGTLGLYCTKDSEGRVYPYSHQASAVLNCLMLKINTYDFIKLKLGTRVTSIEKHNDKYIINCDDEILESDIAIIACGGLASPSLGSDGSIFTMLKSLGIDISAPFPSLCPIQVTDKVLKSLKGIRCKCRASIIADKINIKSELGELQLTENALSGICIFQLSRYINEYTMLGTINGKTANSVYIDIDLFPDLNERDLFRLLQNRKYKLSHLKLDDFLTGLINKKLGQAIFKNCDIVFNNEDGVSRLDDYDLKRLTKALKAWRFKPSGHSSWSNAQVTAGGVMAKELNKTTLESIKHPRLYCIGEAVDIDGECGGFNLHWAWVSAILSSADLINAANLKTEI